MNQPDPHLKRALRFTYWGGLGFRLTAALIAWSLGVKPLELHLGVCAGAYLLMWPLIRADKWNWFILFFGVEWPFFVRGWVVAFGWQSGFAIFHGMLPLFVLQYEHLALRLRIAMAVVPVLLVLGVLVIVPSSEAVVALAPGSLRVLLAANTFIFVFIMVLVVVRVLRIMAREKARAQSLAESRMRLIANMSHELKTPLAAMLTHLQGTLSRDREPERYRRTLGVVERNTRGLGRLVRRMLDFVSAEDVAVNTARQPEELRPLLDVVVEEMAPEAEAKAVTIEIAGPANLTRETDAELFKVILRNLLANAVRYSPEGGVVRLTLASAPRGVPTITVRDEGPGIPDDVLPHIFEAFYRADKARSREDNTFGLGLAIVAEYVDLLGYRIDVDTGPGKGTAFIVTLGA